MVLDVSACMRQLAHEFFGQATVQPLNSTKTEHFCPEKHSPACGNGMHVISFYNILLAKLHSCQPSRDALDSPGI